MKSSLISVMESFMTGYAAERGEQPIWRAPLVGFADACDPGFAELKQAVAPDHLMPGDVLPGARSVIAYYLPFTADVPDGNVAGQLASEAWARAYLLTNDMAGALNGHLARHLAGQGYRAAAPDAGFDTERLVSRWSQRHVAFLAGLGTFGLNNMLIGPLGCAGRYFSLVTDQPLPGDPRAPERCLYKRSGLCRRCAERCPVQAISERGFDRKRCYAQCLVNEARVPGADVCGKCMTGLPCTGA